MALKNACPLKEEIIGDGIDILIVRELTGGIYFGEKGWKGSKKWHEGLRCRVIQRSRGQKNSNELLILL